MLFSLLVHWFLSAIALLVTSKVIPGFRLKDFPSALVTAVVVGLANVSIRPFLLFITLPLNILTFGFFTFVVNAIVLKLCAAILRNFEITSWFSAILGAMLMAVMNYFFQMWFW